MSSQWYYEDHGRAKGPITTGDLVIKIQKGDLNLLDLIFKEGDKAWNPVEHYTEVTDLIGNVTVREESDWIVLRTLEVDGKQRYEQIGPFNIDQVLEMVDKGKASFNDHVWRTGFDNWVPLGRVDKFEKPLPSSITVDLSLYKMPRHEILDKVPPIPVKAYNPVKKIKLTEEAPPVEAQGPDLARPAWMVDPAEPSTVTKIKEKPKPTETIQVTKPEPVKVAAPTPVVVASPPKPVEKIAAKQEAKTADVKAVEVKTAEVKATVPKTSEVKKSGLVLEPQTHTFTHTSTQSTQTRTATERRDLVTEIRATEHRPIKVSVKKSDPLSKPIVEPLASTDVKAEVDEDVTGEVVLSPSPEAIEKMKRRWRTVGQYMGYGFVAGGLILFAIWGLKQRMAGDMSASIPAQMKERPAPMFQPDVLPPPPEGSEVTAAPPAVKQAPVARVEPAPAAPNVVKPVGVTKIQEASHKDAAKEISKDTDKEASLETKTSDDLSKMVFKQKAVYHHAERKFIFYTSQKAIGVANELGNMYRKKGKTPAAWKSGYASWQSSLRSTMGGELKSSQQRLYPDLYNRLRKSLVALDNRAKEFNAQMASGRNPTKEPSVADIVGELKRINEKARALDQ
jgi:hypothetical protein